MLPLVRHTPEVHSAAPLKSGFNRSRKRLNAVAAAVVMCASIAHMESALAVTLGRIVIQSGVGEPLRAEIDVSDIPSNDSSTLRVRLASGEAFRAAGLTFDPALAQSQISLNQRPDGRTFIRLTTAEAISEPFMDLVVEAMWANGRTVRNYTLLLSQPTQASESALVPTTPAPTPAPAREVPTTEEQAPPPVARRVTREQATESLIETQQIQVRPGDTAGRIAAAFRPESVSLDQMLLAMFRNNPQAFLGGNMNRIMAGALVSIPEETEAQAIDPAEARQIIAAQSRDFNEFRRRLAGQVPSSATGDVSERNSSGRIQAEVQDQRAAGSTSDVLTLSKGSVASGASEEEKIARQQQARETSDRTTELSRNLEELAKIQAAAPDSPPVQSSAAAPALPAGGLPAPDALPAPTAAEKASSLVSSLIASPLVLPAAGGLLALLAFTGFVVSRKRTTKQELDSSLSDNPIQTEPSMGIASGLPAESILNGSSSVSLPEDQEHPNSGGVDPVAEADVYLAYGRDLQAEEILKEALSRSPKRIDVHLKLLSIYAKRNDVESFEALVMDAHALTKGSGPEWARICEMGRKLDANTPLFTSTPSSTQAQATSSGGSPTVTRAANSVRLTSEQRTSPAISTTALDLDLGIPSGNSPSPASDAPEVVARSTAGSSAGHSKSIFTPFVNRTFAGLPPELASRIGPNFGNKAQTDTQSDDLTEEDSFKKATAATDSANNYSDPDDLPKVDWDALNLDIDIDPTDSTPPNNVSKK